jgi:hypothetical protein
MRCTCTCIRKEGRLLGGELFDNSILHHDHTASSTHFSFVVPKNNYMSPYTSIAYQSGIVHGC